jgi:hypothetical protein
MRAWLALLVAAACGGGGSTGDDDGGQPDAAVDAPDGAVTPGWTTLIERTWQLAPATEAFRCVRVKIVADTYISAFHVKSPPGTHHELLTISQTATPLGSYDCDASNTDMQMLFAGGIATDDLVLPPGVAIKLPANTYINLNLHVANFSDEMISGTSGVEIKTLAASEVVHEAEAMFLGTFDIHIPPMTMNAVEQGSCSIPQQWNVVNLWPHMHSFAKHQKVTVRRNANGTIDTLLDASYSYMEQKHYPMLPNVQLNPNDELRVECVYDNTTNAEVLYGDSATQEMCFAGFYKYPANGLSKYFCAQL